MTDEQVVDVLVTRLGYKKLPCWCGCDLQQYESPNGSRIWPDKTGLLTSHDAIRPVLAELKQEEWTMLIRKLDTMAGVTIDMRLSPERWTKFLLTLPPRDLAHAIAEAIGSGNHDAPIGKGDLNVN